MLLKWKPWVSFIAEGGRLIVLGDAAAASQHPAQLPLLLKLCSGPRNTAWWNSDLARGLCSFTEAACF